MDGMTDEQILKEFVKRFKVDGAVLLYLDGNQENALSRWKNSRGKSWVKQVFDSVKTNIK